MTEQVLERCYLCWKDFKNPKELDCGHVFCCQCLHKVFVSLSQQSRNTEVNRVLECPLCFLLTDNQDFQIGKSSMKPLLPISTNQTEDSRHLRENLILPAHKRETGVDHWFSRNVESKSTVTLPEINLDLCFHTYASPKHERLPIGWTLSSKEGGVIHVPRKLYKDSSRSFFSQEGISCCDISNSITCAEKENHRLLKESDSREQQFLNSLELAEIQFLQPDSLRGESHHKQSRYNGVNNSVSGVTQTLNNISPDQQQKKILKRNSTEENFLPERNGPIGQNFKTYPNGILCIPNSKYKGVNSVSTAANNKNVRYHKGVHYESSRQQFGGKRPTISTCKYHQEQIASLYCISCQSQTCNVCYFDRHQHCSIQMSKDSKRSLSQYLQEKLIQSEMLKAQLESWVSMFEGEITRIGKLADEMIAHMTEMLKRKRVSINEEIDKIRESPPVRKMHESISECAELEERLRFYLQELRWSSPDNCPVQPFLRSDVPSLCMPSSAELNSISLLRPVSQPNAFVVRTFLEMEEHSLMSIRLLNPVGQTGGEMKIATGEHLAGQNLSHKMENILEQCLPSLPLKLCVFGTIKDEEIAHHDSVDSIVLLRNKSTLLSDPPNLKVKMLSSQGQRLGEVSFESTPNGLCLWKPTVAAVSVSGLQQVYFIDCENVLSVQSVVSTKKPYWGLASGEIERTTCLLGAVPRSSSVDILKYDKSSSSLTILKSISPPKLENWGAICNISFTTKSCIVVADCFGSRVIGFNVDGEIIFDFPGHKDGLLKCAADVTADDHYIYVSDIGNNRILRLSHDGVFNGVILTALDGLLRPKAIDIDKLGHLAISQFTEWPALLIFKTKL